MFEATGYSDALLQRRRGMEASAPTPDGKALPHPAERAPRIFADTADIEAIRTLARAGIIDGVTTNPTLLKRAGATSWEGAKEMMTAILRLLDPAPVSLELTALTPAAMLHQAQELAALGANAVIKVPIGGYGAIDPAYDPHTGLKVLRTLWERDIRTNCTLIFNTTQALWAARAGATYVSPFLGRLADYLTKHDAADRPAGNSLYWIDDPKGGGESFAAHNSEYVASGGARRDAGVRLIREIAQVFAQYDIRTEILAASLRNAAQITECLAAGADILTVPSAILMGVADHPLSYAGMQSFDADAKAFAKGEARGGGGAGKAKKN